MDSGQELSVEALGDEIASLAAQMSAAMCRWLSLVATFDERSGWASEGCVSCAHWVSWRCGVAPVTAREHVRIALALRVLPLVREAFARGELSYSKVRALTRLEGVQREDELLELARQASAAQLERIVAAFRGVTREQADAAYAARSLDVFPDVDGTILVRGRLPAEMGATLVSSLQHAEAQLGTADDDGTERVAAGARRADALVWIADRAAAGAPDDAERGAGARCEVVVHVDAATLTERDVDADADADAGADADTDAAVDADTGPGREEDPAATGQPRTATLEDGPPLAAETIRRLCCDAGIVPAAVGKDGEVLDVGRRTRSIPPAIRRALAVRDGGCRFPGCERTRWLQAHHVEHWAHGGQTRLSNLVLLCHHHHQLVHEGGFELVACAEGGRGFDARTPDGWLLAHVPDTPPGADAGAPMDAFPVPATPPDAPTMPVISLPEAIPGPDRVPGPLSLRPLSSGAPWDLGLAVNAVLGWTARPAAADPAGLS